MKKSEISNTELELAWNFIENTDRSIFLTGKAGTGKTTFLHQVKSKSLKRLIVVAPTGVAAINAKGVTIHSFFQLPFGPIIPDGSQFQQRGNYKMRFGKQKIDIIKSLDLLIIDEISMVRADLLDAIDQVLRRYKDSDKVFGGVQVLMIGDLQQLAPVVNPSEWSLLESYYETAYFFSSRCFQQANALGIELLHIYRQDNPKFIAILNEIRNNNLSQTSADELNKRYVPNFKANTNEGYITLTTHNNWAQKINLIELNNLTCQSHYYSAEIKGTFSEQAFPTDNKLELKVGAQVMFIKNDSSAEKRYFNGKIGTIIKLDKKEVVVKCPEEDEPIRTTPEIWENVKYSINQDSKQITEDFVGSFEQMPLRLAWAITIHKSQGLTFDKAIIDAQESFAHGQTYVALSRCRSLEGMILSKKINPSQIINDQTVLSYIKQVQDNPPTQLDLTLSQKIYQLNLINDLFDYSAFVYPLKRCLSLYYKNQNSLQGPVLETLSAILDNGVNNLLRVNASFSKQLMGMTNDIEMPEKSEALQHRFKKACEYFMEQTIACIKEPLAELSFTTENKEIQKNLDKQIQVLEELVENKLYCIKGLNQGFSSQAYLELRAQAALQNLKPKKAKKDFIETTEHPQLFEELRKYRLELSQSLDIQAFQIFTQQTLFELCHYFPTTTKQLNDIHGMGQVRIEKYGEGILEIIQSYVDNNEVESREVEVQPKKENALKGSTHKQSYELFKKGMSIAEIAEQRGYVLSTIEGHLAKYIESGDILIHELMTKDKYEKIKSNIKGLKFEGLSDLKAQLKDEFTYAELRMALCAIEFEARNK